MQNYQTQSGFSGAVLMLASLLTLVAGFVLGYAYGMGNDPSLQFLGVATTTELAASDRAVTNQNSTNNHDQPAFTVTVASLPAAQQQALRSVGFDDEQIVITHGTVACAQVSIGEVRMNEIKNGASPTAAESVALVGCYTSNQ